MLGKAPLRPSVVRQVLHVLYLGLWGQQEEEVPGSLSQQGHISMLVIPIPAGSLLTHAHTHTYNTHFPEYCSTE